MNLSFRTTFFTAGILSFIIGSMMLIPGMLDLTDGHINAQSFLISGIICLFIGVLLLLMHKQDNFSLTIKEGFFLTTFSWVFVSLIAASPLWLSDLNLSFTDVYFESLSGITTTGSTVLSGLDQMSRGLLLWRSILQWLGGIGIIAFAIILLPFLKIGGMQLFRTESSDRSEKIFSSGKTNYC